MYRNRFDAHGAPLFLAGESYGVTRAAGVAEVLERRGMHVSGAILIGLALPLGELTAEQRIALNVPTYTATAFAQQEACAGSADRPAGDAAQGRGLGGHAICAGAGAARRAERGRAQRRSIADLARFTGFDASLIDRKTLAIPMPQFSEQLLRPTT